MPRKGFACLLAAVVLLTGAFLSRAVLISRLGGAFRQAPEELESGLSPAARRLLDEAFREVDPDRLFDFHTHLLGLGDGGSGAFVNPESQSWRHPLKRLQFEIYFSAAGIERPGQADRDYWSRLVRLAAGFPKPGRHALLAFDQHYDRAGVADPERTEFHVPNAYVFSRAAEMPQRFVAVLSVHPYRTDALEELERWASHGGWLVKWLPNAMGIDPSNPAIDPFYLKMKELGLVLLTHTGEEKAVDAEEAQALGNPLLLRRPLDLGVRVIAAHCASLGRNRDLDDPASPWVCSFDLFLRLMKEPRYHGLLFGEISATTQINRMDALPPLLEAVEIHQRLVNGSDYPLPAVNALISTRRLNKAGYLTVGERDSLNEIYDYNPLLFDLVLKRTLRHPLTGRRFPPSVFHLPSELRPERGPSRPPGP